MDRLEFHPRLVEEAVWAAVAGHAERGRFHREREAIYDLTAPEDRERSFARLNAAWFVRLGLDGPFRLALEEQGDALAGVERILVAPEPRSTHEAAELYVADAGKRSIVIALRPSRAADRERCLEFLRRELMHVADMLDPSFGYEPRLPAHPAGPAHDQRLQERYRVLWDCSVDARLAAAGHLAHAARDRRLAEFARAFASLEEGVAGFFEAVFTAARPRHHLMVRIAKEPEAFFGSAGGASEAHGRCALCGFPTIEFEPAAGSLPEDLVERIRADFPGWEPRRGLCRHCADLYGSRPLSLEAAASIPGARSGRHGD